MATVHGEGASFADLNPGRTADKVPQHPDRKPMVHGGGWPMVCFDRARPMEQVR
jgi:hypothetical protein